MNNLTNNVQKCAAQNKNGKFIAISAIVTLILFTLMIPLANAVTVPNKVNYYIPITLTNYQSTAVAANTPLSYVFNALAYQSYEAATLNNTEFFFANGTIIPSWMEGNYLNEQQQTNTLYTSNSVLYWIKSPSSNVFVSNANIDTLGDDVGSSPNFFTNYVNAYRIQATSSGLLGTIGVKIESTSTNSSQLAIYTDNSGVPGTLLGYTPISAASSTGWINLPVTSNTVNITNGNYYWLAFDYNGKIQTNVDGTGTPYQVAQTFGTMPINPSWTEGSLGSIPDLRMTTGSSTTVYLGFANPATSLWSLPANVGVAPQLTCANPAAPATCSAGNGVSGTYGQYDDGNNIFSFYDNFSGTSLHPQWANGAAGGTITVNNGITLSLPPSQNNNVNLYTNSIFTSDVFETYGDIKSGRTGVTYDNAYFGLTNSLNNGDTMSVGSFFQGTGLVTSGSYVAGWSGGNYVWGVTINSITTTANVLGNQNYANPLLTNSPSIINSAKPIAFNLESQAYLAGTVLGPFDWVRARILPPSKTMPLSSFGSQSFVPPTLSIVSTPSNYGQSITIAATCFSGGTCEVNYPTLGTSIATGGGGPPSYAIYTYSAGALGAGTYSNYYAYSLGTSQNSIGQTITVNQIATPLVWTTQCFASTYPNPCTTTAQITTYNNQLTGMLYLNGNLIGSTTTTISNALTFLGPNTYVFNTIGNGNYIANSITYTTIGFVPIYAQNTIATSAANDVSPFLWNTIYPVELYSPSTVTTATYTLLQNYNGGAQTVVISNTPLLNYIPPANQPTGNYVYNVAEFTSAGFIGNYVTIAANTLSMASIASNLGFTGLCANTIQYAPNCAFAPVWGTTPLNWKILNNDNPRNIFTANYVTGTNNIDVFSNSNLTFYPQILLTYPNIFTSPVSFIANAVNNPAITSINQIPYLYVASANTPTSAYNRKLMVINTYDQQFFTNINAITAVDFNWNFNNYSFASGLSIITNNTNTIYIPGSNFNNPPVNITNLFTSSTQSGYNQELNNYLNGVINKGTWKTLDIYLPNANAVLNTFNVYQCSGTPTITGDYALVSTQIAGGTSAVQTQSYKIQANPFSLYLQNGQPYQIQFMSPSNGLLYTLGLGILQPSVSVTLPCIVSQVPLQGVNINATCYSTLSTNTVTCMGTDSEDYVTQWNIKATYSPTILNQETYLTKQINGTAFTWSYQFPNHTTTFYISITATLGRAIDPSSPVLTAWPSWVTNSNIPTPAYAYDAFFGIILFFIFIGVAYVNPIAALIGWPILLILGNQMGFIQMGQNYIVGSIVIMVIAAILMAIYRD